MTSQLQKTIIEVSFYIGCLVLVNPIEALPQRLYCFTNSTLE